MVTKFKKAAKYAGKLEGKKTAWGSKGSIKKRKGLAAGRLYPYAKSELGEKYEGSIIHEAEKRGYANLSRVEKKEFKQATGELSGSLKGEYKSLKAGQKMEKLENKARQAQLEAERAVAHKQLKQQFGFDEDSMILIIAIVFILIIIGAIMSIFF